MARKKKSQENEVVWQADEDSDKELGDYGDIDGAPEEFNPKNDMCEDPFLNELCEEHFMKNIYFDGEDEETDEAGQENDVEHENLEEREDGVGLEYRVHDSSMKWHKMKPIVGELYESPAQLRFALTNYAVANSFQIWFKKSDRNRIIAECGRNETTVKCPWRLYAAWKYNERTFQIKSMVDTYLCARNYEFGSLVTCNWLAKHYLKDVIRRPKMTLPEMKEDVLRKYSVSVSIGQCHRARVRARELIEGKLEDHYAMVYDYAAEILRSNPGSTCKVGVTVNWDGKNYFKRIYVCFKALSDGWNRGCRRVVGLDGCFLKGQVKGELLTAIRRDADNHVFPIAWAVVDVENKDNWSWFLVLLVSDLSINSGHNLVVISDQHKGLVESVRAIMPHAQHRQCARHIFANFQKGFGGLQMKNKFWAAANSTIIADFEKNMAEIQKVTQKGYDWLMARNPPSWCRAYFATGFGCESLENGISECFNAMIVHIRKKPLLTMLEEIRIYMMSRGYFMAEKVKTWKTDRPPEILERMKEFGQHMRDWKVLPSGKNVFETRHMFEGYKVDLVNHTCSCHLWGISGIPCVHAQAAINYCHKSPADYLSHWFSKAKYEAAYQDNILPVDGSNKWPVSNCIPPLPPLVRRLPGRPKTKRRKHASELQEKKYPPVRAKVKRTVKCTKCQQFGHNKTACGNDTVTPAAKEPRKTGRPRKIGSTSAM